MLIDNVPLQTIENCRNLLALLQMVDTDCMCERAQTGLTEALASIDHALGHYMKQAIQEKHAWLKEAQQ